MCLFVEQQTKVLSISHLDVKWEQLNLRKQSLADYRCDVKEAAIKDV